MYCCHHYLLSSRGWMVLVSVSLVELLWWQGFWSTTSFMSTSSGVVWKSSSRAEKQFSQGRDEILGFLRLSFLDSFFDEPWRFCARVVIKIFIVVCSLAVAWDRDDNFLSGLRRIWLCVVLFLIIHWWSIPSWLSGSVCLLAVVDAGSLTAFWLVRGVPVLSLFPWYPPLSVAKEEASWVSSWPWFELTNIELSSSLSSSVVWDTSS